MRLQLADGQPLHAQGLVLCNVCVGDKTVLEVIYAAPTEDNAILGLDTLRALTLNLSVAGVSLEWRASVRRVTVPYVCRIKVSKECIISSRSEVTVHGQLEGPQLKHYTLVSAGNENVCDKLMVGKFLVKVTTVFARCVLRTYRRRKLLCPPVNTLVRLKKVDMLSNEENTSALLPSSSPPTLAHNLPGHIRDLFEETCEREQLDAITVESQKQLRMRYADVAAAERHYYEMEQRLTVTQRECTLSNRAVQSYKTRAEDLERQLVERERKLTSLCNVLTSAVKELQSRCSAAAAVLDSHGL